MSVENIETILAYVIPAMIIGVALWVAISLYVWQRRKVLNLTVAETVKQSGTRPDFLSVDAEARQAKLDGGAAFDKHIAERDTPRPDPAPTATKCSGLVKVVTVIFALITLVTGIIGALLRVKIYDDAVRSLGVWENIETMVTTYPIGFAVALGIVAVSGFNTLRKLRAST